MLRNTDRDVTEICFSVGLASVGSFTTSFHRVYGLTPLPIARRSLRRRGTSAFHGCVAQAYGRPQNRTFGEVASNASS